MAVRRLVCEADVRSMARGSELVLGGGTLATPAALDLAFERGIRVVHASGEAAPGRVSGGADPLWTSMLAGDGTYVVQVRGGRPSVTLLGPAGPQPFPGGRA